MEDKGDEVCESEKDAGRLNEQRGVKREKEKREREREKVHRNLFQFNTRLRGIK